MFEERKPKISLDDKILLPLKKEFEATISDLMKVTFTLDKETEINLKIVLDKEKKTKIVNDVWRTVETPVIKYQITEKVKEHKSVIKNTLGSEFEIEDSEDGFKLKEVVKQKSLFEDKEEE